MNLFEEIKDGTDPFFFPAEIPLVMEIENVMVEVQKITRHLYQEIQKGQIEEAIVTAEGLYNRCNSIRKKNSENGYVDPGANFNTKIDPDF